MAKAAAGGKDVVMGEPDGTAATQFRANGFAGFGIVIGLPVTLLWI